MDTNVWISAYAGSNLCMELTLYLRQRHQAVVCPQVLQEFEKTVTGKLKLPQATAKRWRSQVIA